MKHKLTLFSLTACLCAAAFTAPAQTRILPLGDSVTSSFAPHSSYRYWLWHALIDSGYNVDFVGTQHGVTGGEPANADFDQDHEGHTGWTTSDALFVIDSIANATHPDIVLLDLGSNDVADEIPLENIVANLHEIIQHLRAVNPNVVILMARSTPSVGDNGRAMSRLRSAVKKVAKSETQPGSKVIAVNLSGGFNAKKNTFDGMHPNEVGEQKIARKYYRVLRKLFRRLNRQRK